MKKIHISDTTQPKGYDVIIGTDILKELPSLIDTSPYSNIFIVTDEHAKVYVSYLTSPTFPTTHTILIPSGDQNKTIDTVQTIWKELFEKKADRKSLVINLGGGVIGDMGGFAASTYMRGIDFVQIPTTLLAQVDASVGGKVGINFNGVKNSIGSFQQPIAVIIDVQTLKTLPSRQLKAGFAEIIKHGLIADSDYFSKVTEKSPEAYSEDELVDIITRSVEIKHTIIASDLTEKGPRKLVNFGHTVGHAIESISHTSPTPLLHGEAVAIGMLVEAKLSQKTGLLQEKDVQTIELALLKAGLPTQYKIEDKTSFMQKIMSDKKNVSGTIKWTLLRRIGEAVYDQEIDSKVVKEILNF